MRFYLTFAGMDAELIVNNVKRYVPLNPEEQEFFLEQWSYKEVKKKEILLQTGEIARHIYFVLKGCLRAYYVDSNGFEHNIQFAIEDWWISDVASFFSQKPALLYVEALEDSEIMMTDNIKMEKLYIEIPSFERFFRILLQNAFVAHQQRILSMISMTAEERYAEFIEMYPVFDERIPQVHVASYLGVTPEFLSKLRKKIFSAK